MPAKIPTKSPALSVWNWVGALEDSTDQPAVGVQRQVPVAPVWNVPKKASLSETVRKETLKSDSFIQPELSQRHSPWLPKSVYSTPPAVTWKLSTWRLESLAQEAVAALQRHRPLL